MRVLCILCVYNERWMIPFKLDWCKKNNLDLYVIDNYSTDGTWEWLQDHHIASSRVDTKGSFDTRIIEREKIKIVNEIKPDWVVNNGADLFYFVDGTLNDYIQLVDDLGYNMIQFDMIDVFRTKGEDYGSPFMFKYYKYSKPVTFIYKHQPGVSISGDDIHYRNPKVFKGQGVLVNYGRTQPVEYRKERLKRRIKAWQKGLNRKYGRHYLREQQKGWTWDRSELDPIRTSKYARYIHKHTGQNL